jgi:hypothetical protein
MTQVRFGNTGRNQGGARPKPSSGDHPTGTQSNPSGTNTNTPPNGGKS